MVFWVAGEVRVEKENVVNSSIKSACEPALRGRSPLLSCLPVCAHACLNMTKHASACREHCPGMRCGALEESVQLYHDEQCRPEWSLSVILGEPCGMMVTGIALVRMSEADRWPWTEQADGCHCGDVLLCSGECSSMESMRGRDSPQGLSGEKSGSSLIWDPDQRMTGD
jgi:hypothetical protein